MKVSDAACNISILRWECNFNVFYFYFILIGLPENTGSVMSPNNLTISQLLLPTLAAGTTITPVVSNNNLIPPPLGDNQDTSNASSNDTVQPLKENATLTSNDDSLDSNGGKRRRKRKPNKTTRMSSSDNDESAQRSNDQKRLCFDADVGSTKPVQSHTTVEDTMRTVAAAAATIDAGRISDISDYEKTTNLPQNFHPPTVINTVEPLSAEVVNTHTKPLLPVDDVADVTELQPANAANLPSNMAVLPTNIPLLPTNVAALSAHNNGPTEAGNVSNYHGKDARNGQSAVPARPIFDPSASMNPLPPPPASPDECANMSRSSTPIQDERSPSASYTMADERIFTENFLQNNLVNERQSTNNDDDDSAPLTASNKKRTVSDDCETIDKIAAMIASTATTSDSECIDAGKQTASVISPPEVTTPPLKICSEAMDKNALDNGGLAKLSDVSHVSSTAKKVKSPLAKDPSFEDVENKLEEMFAGIEDDRPVVNDVQPPASDQTKTNNNPGTGADNGTKVTTKNDTDAKSVKPKLNASKASTKKSTKTEKQPIKAASPLPTPPPPPAPTPASSTPIAKRPVTKAAKKSTVSSSASKNKKSLAAKNNQSKQTKASANNDKRTKSKDEYGTDTTANAGKYKGPYVQVKNDGSSNVINTPITEEIAEMKSKNKKPFNSSINNDRNKIRGLHVSTLSTKYDADTTDKTWICVFCKMGPHKYGLGDLFGPYILTTSCDEYQYSQVDPQCDDFKSKRTKVDMIQKRGLPVSVTDSSSTVTGNVSIYHCFVWVFCMKKLCLL